MADQDEALGIITPSNTSGTLKAAPLRGPNIFEPVEVEQDTSTPDHTILERLSAAKDRAWTIRSTSQIAEWFADGADDSPEVTEDDWKALPDSYTKEQLEAFRDLVDSGGTEQQWEDLEEEFATTNEAREIAAEYGWQGTGLTMVASLFDPTFIAAAAGATASSAAIGGVGALPVVAARAARVSRLAKALATASKTTKSGRMMRVLAEAGTAEAAYGGLRASERSDYTGTDMTIDMLFALGTVGAIDGVFSRSAIKAAKAMEHAQTRAALGEGPGGSMGAAKVDANLGWHRVDDYAKFMNTGNTEMQEFARHVLRDPVAGGVPTAAVTAQRERENLLSGLNASFKKLLKKKQKEQSFFGGVTREARQRNVLSELVWEAVVLGADHGPEVSKAAAVIRKQNSDILDKARAAGLRGFKELEDNPRYMRQQWDSHGWRKAMQGEDALSEKELSELIYLGLDTGDTPLEVVIKDLEEKVRRAERAAKKAAKVKKKKSKKKDKKAAEASRAKLAELEEQLAKAVGTRTARQFLATGFTKRMLSKADGDSRPLSELMADEGGLVDWLREVPEYAQKTEEEVKELVKTALSAGVNKGRNVVDRGKRRINIDPAASITKGGRVHRVADLMKRDAHALQQSYIHEMTGHIELAKHLDIRGPEDWQKFIAEARRKEIEIRRGDPKAEQKAQGIEDMLEEMKREVYGHNRFGLTGVADRWVSTVMKYNFMTAMGLAALSAFSEVARTLSEAGVRDTIRVLPSLRKIVTDSFRDVNKHRTIIKEVNDFNASIGDSSLIRFFNHFDEEGVRTGEFTDGILNKAEIYAHRGARAMSKASLLAPMDKALRFVSFQSSMNSLYRHLMKGKKTNLAFREIGMTKELLARVKENMQKHGVETDAFGSVSKLNIEKWDRKTADDLMDVMTVNTSRQVQQTIAGEGVRLASHPVGRVFMQFRTFALDSYSKYLLADIHSARNGNALRVAMQMMYASILASLGYTSRTYLAAIGMGKDKRKEYLEERLAPSRLAANVLAYNPTTGAVVSLWNMTGGWVANDFAIPVMRSSGLATGGIGSNPTTDTVSRIGRVFNDIPGQSAKSWFDTARYSIPFQNTIWGGVILNTAARELED